MSNILYAVFIRTEYVNFFKWFLLTLRIKDHGGENAEDEVELRKLSNSNQYVSMKFYSGFLIRFQIIKNIPNHSKFICITSPPCQALKFISCITFWFSAIIIILLTVLEIFYNVCEAEQAVKIAFFFHFRNSPQRFKYQSRLCAKW